VTFPKLVVHAAMAGLYGGLVVALLLRLANSPGGSERGWPVVAPLVVVLGYTLAAAFVWPVLYAALRFFASHRLRLGWLSLRYANGFLTVNMAALLASGWTMLSEYRSGLAPPVADRLTRVCVFLTIAWLVEVTVATAPSLRRRTAPQAAAAGIAFVALLVSLRLGPASSAGTLAAATRPDREEAADPTTSLSGGPGTDPSSRGTGSGPAAGGRRLLLLNFDGADLDTILTMQAQGKLPGFSRLVQEGSYGRLVSIAPCVAPVTRATLITGMLPYRHGVRSDQIRSVLGRPPRLDIVPPGIGFDLLLSPVLERRASSVSDRRTQAFWEISERQGGRGEAAGWDIDLDDARAEWAEVSTDGAQRDWIGKVLDLEVMRQKDPKARSLVREITRAVAADAAVLEALRRFGTRNERGVAALSFPGIDRVAHVFLRYARPADFGNVGARDVDLYGPVLERYYRRIDGIVESALRAEAESTLVLVTATHGIEPAPPLHRLRDEILGGEHLSGVHEDAPAGFLFAHGVVVSRGRVFGKGSIADVTPTVLYALGLPVARDAHGSILAGVFSEAYTASHPVTVIGSYELNR